MKPRKAARVAEPMIRKEYEQELRKLQAHLCSLQEWVKHKGLRVIVIFEGRDAAGKGGTIKALTECVSPRVFRLVALPAPSDREKTPIYMQRYIPHFPAAGEVVIFDRSWYNRAGVERVMGFCTKEQCEGFLQRAPEYEKDFVKAGIHLIKFWLEVGDEEQKRSASRIASTIRASSGSSVRWICPRASAGTTTRARAMRCSRPRTPSTRPGTSCARTTSAARG